MEKQNAKVNYFFGGIYKDCRDIVLKICKAIFNIVLYLYGFIAVLVGHAFVNSWKVIKGVFERWVESIGEPWEETGDAFVDFKDTVADDIIDHIDFADMFCGFFKALFYAAKFGFFFAYALVNVVLAPVICIVFTVLFLGVEVALFLAVAGGATVVGVTLIVAIGIITAISYIGIGLIAFGIGVAFCTMSFIDFMYRKIHRLFSGCPSCQKKFDLPIYVCDCGREQTRLLPSKYGILKRTCLCGRKLPTTFLNGRQKLHSRCPYCRYDSIAGGAHTEVWIPVIGGPSAGKTCFINMAITQIGSVVASKYNLDFTYQQQGDDPYNENKQIMEQGLLPQKTSDMNLKFYQFNLAPKNSKIGNHISICDVAGELYADNEDFKQGSNQGGFSQADGFVLIVDPLSITDYRTELEDSKSVQAYDYGASDKPMDEIVSILFTTLDNIRNNTKSIVKPSCSIVFTKCDIPGLDELIGEEAVNNYMAAHKCDRLTALNAVCEAFLGQYGESNFLQFVKQRFTSFQFFTCSALGHNADGSEFSPVHVEDGILWILDKCCHTLNFYKNGSN